VANALILIEENLIDAFVRAYLSQDAYLGNFVEVDSRVALFKNLLVSREIS
jgi:hypothetical protein